MSAKKPESIRVNGSFDHKIHHIYIGDELKEQLEAHGFRLDKAFVENERYYSIVASRLPDEGFEPLIQTMMDDPEMPPTLTFRYAYTNAQGSAAGYGGGYCKITKKSVEWADVDAMPVFIDTLRVVQKEAQLSDRSKKAIGRAMERVEYPSELATLSNRIQVMGLTM
jgi:hypothetical protein